VLCDMTIAGSGKRQARPPVDHFKKLLEETCPSHAYAIKHKLRDCGMMKSFMVLVSLTQGIEFDEVPDKGDTMPFPRKDVVMTMYDGRPSPGMHHVSNPSLGTPALYCWGRWNAGMDGHKFSWTFTYVEI
jgi:hypothetical protein